LAVFTAAGRAVVGAVDAAAQRVALGLGGSATKDVGTSAGTVAAGDHTHSDLEALIAGLEARVSALEGP
jgi:glycerate kinase